MRTLDPLEFFHIHSIAKHQKNEEGLLVKKISKKVPQCGKNWIGGPFSLAQYCMFGEEKEKPFWFSSLGQMVQFDTIKFYRTIKLL